MVCSYFVVAGRLILVVAAVAWKALLIRSSEHTRTGDFVTDIDSNALLNQLARYTASGALTSQYSLPILGRLADETTPPLDGEQLIEALLAHGDPAIAAMAPRVAAARQSEAAKLHAARRDKRLSSTQTVEEEFPLLADLPLDVRLGWETLALTLKQLAGTLSLAKDVRFAAEHRINAPQ
ncbi:MAG: hypothetical protein ACI93T_003992, partial [Porticoccaceae bacterium]